MKKIKWDVTAGNNVISKLVIADSAEAACDAVRKQFPNRLASVKLNATCVPHTRGDAGRGIK
jgi:hypothetical protein